MSTLFTIVFPSTKLHTSNSSPEIYTQATMETPPTKTPPMRTPGGTPHGVPAGHRTIFVITDKNDPKNRCYLAISYDVSDGKTPKLADPMNDNYRWIVYEYIDMNLTVYKRADPRHHGRQDQKADDETFEPPTDVTTNVVKKNWQAVFEREVSSFPSAQYTGRVKAVIDGYLMSGSPEVRNCKDFVEEVVDRIMEDALPRLPDENGFPSSTILSGGNSTKKLDELFGPPLEIPEGYQGPNPNQGQRRNP